MSTTTTPKPDIVAFLAHIAEQEKHFNELETEYRKLASTWLLAAMGGCGYVLTADKIPLDVTWLLVSAIGYMSSVGIFVLYVMDLNVYHKMAESYFVEGLYLELKHSDWIRPIRMRMLKALRSNSVTKRVSFYYFTSIALLMGIGLTGLRQSNAIKTPCFEILESLTLIVLAVLLNAMFRYSKNEEAIELLGKYDLKKAKEKEEKEKKAKEAKDQENKP